MLSKNISHCSKATENWINTKRRKRKLSCSPVDELQIRNRYKKQRKHAIKHYYSKRFCQTADSFSSSESNEKLVIEEKKESQKVKPSNQTVGKVVANNLNECSAGPEQKKDDKMRKEMTKCWIDELPQEILLKIFGYLPLGMLLHTIPQVCKRWEVLALDWTLWKSVEDLTIKNMVISTSKLKTLLRTIPKLKKLELILRNDTEELLHELFATHQNLEVLKLDRCYRSTLQMNILSHTATSILESCPNLKTVMLTDTYFHSKNFYRCLAKKFKTIERINVTCTTKSEMDVFMENLKENVPEVEFQRVPMMGRAEGKQIYWGPILGLVVRPIPTSPFHQQYIKPLVLDTESATTNSPKLLTRGPELLPLGPRGRIIHLIFNY